MKKLLSASFLSLFAVFANAEVYLDIADVEHTEAWVYDENAVTYENGEPVIDAGDVKSIFVKLQQL